MNMRQKTTFGEILFTHFVPCLFVGVMLLYAIGAILPQGSLAGLVDDMFTGPDILMGLVVGIGVAGIVLLFHRNRNKRLRQLGAKGLPPANSQKLIRAAAVGFLAGASDVLLLLHTEGVIILTVVVFIILVWHVRAFSRNVAQMLHPKSVATWADVFELSRIYLTMLTGFTMVNAALEGTHLLAGNPPPFGFIEAGGDLFLNALYFTVVTMTTLGFGDIVPQTWDAKLLLITECLVGYIMFALVVGIITRGVIRAGENRDETKEI